MLTIKGSLDLTLLSSLLCSIFYNLNELIIRYMNVVKAFVQFVFYL